MPLLATGVLGLLVAFWGLARDVGFIAQPFYAWAWWSYIFVLDGFVALRCRTSILTSRRYLLLPLLLWSVTFWFFFELLNLRFQNWYYVGVFAREGAVDLLKGATFGVFSFATVFLGIFETTDALEAAGLGSRRGRSLRLPPWVTYGLQGVGLLMVAAAVFFPHFLAPLVWGSVTFLLDPWNYRHGARSLLADLEAGAFGSIFRLLVAGLLCGLVWESFNYLAPQKWIYTVRGLEELKLFEMPLAGFLGFPALALDAFSFFAFVSYWCHGNRTWEESVHLAPRVPLSSGVLAATLPIHVLFWIGTGFLVERVNVGSIELRLESLTTLPAETLPNLWAGGIERPRQLLRALEDRELRQKLDLSQEALEAIQEEAELLDFKGIGCHHGRLLQRAGVLRVSDLARQDPEALFATLRAERGDATFPALRLEMVRVWVLSARERWPPLLEFALEED
jgi:hypothetical protein